MQSVTSQVRQFMRDNGRRLVYSNKYGNCRTVKCYGATKGPDAPRLVKKLKARFEPLGCEVKVGLPAGAWFGSARSIIVRVPFDVQPA